MRVVIKQIWPVFAAAAAMFFSVAFSIAWLAKSAHVSRPENGLYNAAVRSVLEDGDLNLINQAYPEQRWLVSSTYNLPDFREHGSAALWLPFFAYGLLLPELNLESERTGKPVSHDDAAVALATLFFTFSALIFALAVMRFYLGERHARLSIALMIFGTPALWYLVMEPYGTDLSSNFVASASLFLYLLLSKIDSPVSWKWWLALGTALAFGATVKPHGIFYLAITFQVAYRCYLSRWEHGGWRPLVALLAGAAAVLALHAGNQFLKFGALQSQYWELMRFFRMFGTENFFSSPWNLLFGPDGAFYVSPIYLFSVVGAGLWAFTAVRRGGMKISRLMTSFRFALVAIPVASFLMTGFTHVGELIGAGRRFMAQQPAFLLTLQYLLVRSERTSRKLFAAILGAAVIALAWNVFMTLRFGSDKDSWGASYLSEGKWEPFIAEFGEVIGYFPSVIAGLIGWIPIIVAAAWALIHTWRSVKDVDSDVGGVFGRRALCSAAIWIGVPVLIFAGISVSNFCFNRENARRMRNDGFFASTVVGRGMTLYIYDDLISLVPKFKFLGASRKNPGFIRDSESMLSRYLTEAAAQVTVDPIGFRDDCLRGIMRPSYFSTPRS